MSRNLEILKIIFITGLIAGLFFGASIKMGEDVKPEALLLKMGYIFCDALKNINPDSSTECKTWMFWTSITIIIIGIVEILSLIFAANNWLIGTSVYVIGFMFGLIIVV